MPRKPKLLVKPAGHTSRSLRLAIPLSLALSLAVAAIAFGIAWQLQARRGARHVAPARVALRWP